MPINQRLAEKIQKINPDLIKSSQKELPKNCVLIGNPDEELKKILGAIYDTERKMNESTNNDQKLKDDLTNLYKFFRAKVRMKFSITGIASSQYKIGVGKGNVIYLEKYPSNVIRLGVKKLEKIIHN